MTVDPFTYRPPTPETGPRYAAIRAAAEAASAEIRRVLAHPFWEGEHVAHYDPKPGYEAINTVCRDLHNVIDELAPAGALKTAALGCAQIARMAANDANTPSPEETELARFTRVRRADVALTQIDMARWQACAAIALAPTHPPLSTIGGAE